MRMAQPLALGLGRRVDQASIRKSEDRPRYFADHLRVVTTQREPAHEQRHL
jgi:hypothetical protein